jgi:hypothetical protein
MQQLQLPFVEESNNAGVLVAERRAVQRRLAAARSAAVHRGRNAPGSDARLRGAFLYWSMMARSGFDPVDDDAPEL